MDAGLRREEAASIQFTDIIKQDKRYVLNVTGKGAKSRVVPISERMADAITDWQYLIGAEGLILRRLGRNKEPRTASALRCYITLSRNGEG